MGGPFGLKYIGQNILEENFFLRNPVVFLSSKDILLFYYVQAHKSLICLFNIKFSYNDLRKQINYIFVIYILYKTILP